MDTSKIDNPVDIYRLLVLRGCLKLEVMGMQRSRPPSAYSQIKKEFEFKGTRESVLQQLDNLIDQKKKSKSVGQQIRAGETIKIVKV